jgi:hypothetical protein
MAVNHRDLHRAHVANQVDGQRDRDLLLAPLDELGGLRLPLVRGTIPEPRERHDAGQDQCRKPRRDRSSPGSKRILRRHAHSGTSF